MPGHHPFALRCSVGGSTAYEKETAQFGCPSAWGRICSLRSLHLQRTRPQRSRQQVRHWRWPQRSRQHRRQEACVTSLRFAVISAGSGAIGAAWTFPGMTAKSKPATDIAKTVRNIVCLRFSEFRTTLIGGFCSGRDIPYAWASGWPISEMETAPASPRAANLREVYFRRAWGQLDRKPC